ncbi:MAG: AAA family ATPase [Nitrospinae bacterium]|nr:AAA family ATPase [Nitrospinota bacterium]
MSEQELATELKLLIRSRFPIIYLLTHEEERAEKLIASIAAELNKKTSFWSITSDDGSAQPAKKATDALDTALASTESSIITLRDFHHYMENDQVIRKLRDLAREFSRSQKTLVILSPTLKTPPELEKDITIIDMPMPGRADIRGVLEEALAFAARNPKLSVSLTEDDKDAVVSAAMGLTLTEARRIFSKCLLTDHSFDSRDIQLILFEKKQLIRKSGTLEYFDTSENMNSVGGLDYLKKWLVDRKSSFTKRARDYGLPMPKGLLLLGVQGCGKSLAAKAVANLWSQPLLRLDMGRIFSSYIGSSEENIRKAIATAESLSPVILWIDEIEKGFSGIKSSGATDAGVTARIFGTFLTWMQEKKRPVFVIATANSIEDLPPELLRKGRFDEIFFIDLPGDSERGQIFNIHIEKRKRKVDGFDIGNLVAKSKGYSGAEIEMAIVEAMHTAFAENREFISADISHAMELTVPLSRTMAENIEALRQWAQHRARPASAKNP